MRRSTSLRIAAAAAAFAALLFVVVAGLASTRKPSQAPPAPARLAVGSALDRPVPNFSLLDERGRRTSLADFGGRYVVLAPSLTLCHEVCPMTTGVLEQMQRTLSKDGLGRDAVVVEATVDPWRDTPARVRAYRRLAGVNFRMLTGSPAQIRRLWKFFGVYYKRAPQGKPADVDWWTHKPETFDVEHTDGLFIVDPQRHWRAVTLGMPSVGGRLAPRLRRLLNAEGRRNLRHPDQPWTARQALADVFALKQHDDAASGGPAERVAVPTPEEARKELAGSPPTLAALHAQATSLLGGGLGAFRSRLAALHGRPVVINEWASWCFPCRDELPLFQSASVRYGKRVAFLGVNVNDNAGDASSFLRQHPVSYPSYQDPDSRIASSFATAQALPITVYIGAGGKHVYTHIGYYPSRAALDSDIARYALG